MTMGLCFGWYCTMPHYTLVATATVNKIYCSDDVNQIMLHEWAAAGLLNISTIYGCYGSIADNFCCDDANVCNHLTLPVPK